MKVGSLRQAQAENRQAHAGSFHYVARCQLLRCARVRDGKGEPAGRSAQHRSEAEPCTARPRASRGHALEI